MALDAASAVWLLLLGGWMAVDGTTVGQFMVSRSLVSATLAGWIVGNAGGGLIVGILLELLHLAVLPVGAASFPESGPAAVVSGGLYGLAHGVPGALIMTILFALAWEWVGGATLRGVRQINIRVVGSADPEQRVERLQTRHLVAIGIDFGRGILVTGVGMAVLSALLLLTGRLPMQTEIARFGVEMSMVGLFAAALGIFPGRRRIFLSGALLGLIFVLLRG